MRKFCINALVALSVLLLASESRAIIVAGGTGSEQTSDPGSGFPWGNVGSINGASGVYLGSYNGGYWVLTASHVVGSGGSLGNITLGGQSYAPVGGSGIVIQNSNGTNTDMTLFRISTDPLLPNLTLASTAPTAGATVYLVGYGLRETGSQLFWNVTGSGAGTTWNALGSSSGANASGYAIGNGGTERYGGSTIVSASSLGLDSFYNVGTGQTQSVLTQFQQFPGFSQAALGDSGGALFYNNGSGWMLSGILGAVTSFTNQPNGVTGTAIFGQATYAGDVAFYQSAIISSVPEPANTAALLALAVVAGAIWRRKVRQS